MPRYRCCFMAEAGEVVGVEMFDAPDESYARERADHVVARVGYPAVEVWDHTGMIYRSERPPERAARVKVPRRSIKSDG